MRRAGKSKLDSRCNSPRVVADLFRGESGFTTLGAALAIFAALTGRNVCGLVFIREERGDVHCPIAFDPKTAQLAVKHSAIKTRVMSGQRRVPDELKQPGQRLGCGWSFHQHMIRDACDLRDLGR